MSEQLVSMNEEEILFRNNRLQGKKRGMQLALILMAIACFGLVYLLQKQEKIDENALSVISFIVTGLLGLTALAYARFSKKISQDMQSHEKIVTMGILIRFLRRQPNNEQSVTLDIDGKWMTLDMNQLRRLTPDVIQTQNLLLNDRFELEFTPHGRHLMRATRL